jgi:hypothetical protein
MAVIFAEIAAAELAAAAAAEAAAVTAAEVAAAEAASVAAAEAASTAAAQTAAQAAAQQTTQAGILGIEGATANPAALTSEAVQNAAMNSGADITAKGSLNPSTGQFINTTLPPEPVFQNIGGQGVTTPQTFPVNDGGITSVPQAAPPAPNTPPMGLEMPGAYTPSNYPMGMEGQIPANQFIEPGSAGMPSMENTIAQTNIAPPPPPSGLEAGFDKALKFAEKNPFTAMTGAYMGASALGLLNPSGATFNNTPYDGPLSKYKLSPNFQAGNANPANFQYNPATNRRYAEGGGIMGADPYSIPVGYAEGEMVQNDVPEYAKGGSLSDSITSYQKMLGGQPQAAPARSADVGIYYDQDPDTRYQDALTAAQIRQAKVNQRAYVSPPAAKRPEPLGRLNMPTSAKNKDSVEAAHGGIMHSSLGGYAAGGNPRLLKGPGDGMSDNIPATISGRQPARLADGEFVIPADVVSHLGNGSTEAGAKQLHAMMNKVRKARTGNPKQGKQINARKYMPK